MGMSLGVTFADHSSMTLTWELQRDLEVTTRWPEIYDKLGDPPYLVVLVLDNGVAIKDDKRVREHEAERRLAEIHKLMGGEGSKRLMGVIAASVDETDSRRKYFWKVY